MTDDKKKRGGADRAQVSREQGYEVGYFATKHGISRDAARKLFDEVGSNREKLNAAAERLKKR
jgi:D-tyrosyl-tRNA(Tyr) deacylase